MQSELDDFEKYLSLFTESKYAIGVANATDGLELAIHSLNLSPGDQVICSSHTMLATASAIKLSGAIPVPVDIGLDGLIDPCCVENAINTSTVGIMPTHLNGRTCEMNKIMKIAKSNNLFVVEDAAQALGSRFRGQHAGTFGYAGAISFYPAKVLGCLGDGGALLTNKYSTFDKLYQLHDHGRNSKGEQISWGRNSRLDNINAAILDFKLKSYTTVVNRRRNIASAYEVGLNQISEIKLPPAPNDSTDNFDVYQNYEIVAENRDNLREFLKGKGIGTLIQWGGKALHQWKGLGLERELPVTDKYFKRCLMLPINLFVSDCDIAYVIESIREFYR